MDTLFNKIHNLKDDLSRLDQIPNIILSHFILDRFKISKKELLSLDFMFNENNKEIIELLSHVEEAFDPSNKFFAKKYIELKQKYQTTAIHDTCFLSASINKATTEPSATNNILFRILFDIQKNDDLFFRKYIKDLNKYEYKQLLAFILAVPDTNFEFARTFVLKYLSHEVENEIQPDPSSNKDYLDIYTTSIDNEPLLSKTIQIHSIFFNFFMNHESIFLKKPAFKLPLDYIILSKKMSFKQKAQIIDEIFSHNYFKKEESLQQKTQKFLHQFRFQFDKIKPGTTRILLTYLINKGYITPVFDNLNFISTLKPSVIANKKFIQYLQSKNVDFNKIYKATATDTNTHFIFTNSYNMHLDWHGCDQNIIFNSYKKGLELRLILQELGFKNPIPLLSNKKLSPLFSFNLPSNFLKEILLSAETPKELSLALFGCAEKRFRKLAMDNLIANHDKKFDDLKSIMPFHINLTSADFNLIDLMLKPQGFNTEYFTIISTLSLKNLITNTNTLYRICSLNFNPQSIKPFIHCFARIFKFIREDYIESLLSPFTLDESLIDQHFMHLIRDTHEMCKTMQNKYPEYTTKAKSINELHDQLFYDLMLKTHENVNLIGNNSLRLDNHKLTINNNEYEIIIPKTKFDLLTCGNNLSFCIGTANYHERINKGELFAFMIHKNNELYGAITIKQKDLSYDQANIKRNRPFETDELHEILKYIRSKLLELKDNSNHS